MIFAVTPELREELSRAAAYRKSMADARKNDKKHYAGAVDRLDKLTMALLACQSAQSLVGQVAGGVRIDYDPDSNLAILVVAAARHLRNFAAPLLQGDGAQLSIYNTDRLDCTLDVLDELYNGIVDAIVKRARDDLKDVLAKIGVNTLMELAEGIGDTAASA